MPPLAFQWGPFTRLPFSPALPPPCSSHGFVPSTLGSESPSPGLARRRGPLRSPSHTASPREAKTSRAWRAPRLTPSLERRREPSAPSA